MMVYYTFDWSILQIPDYAYMKQVDVEHRRQKKKASYQSKKKQKNNKVNFSLFVMLNHF